MKRALLGLALVITIIVAITALVVSRANDDMSDPAATVRKALDAYEANDSAAVQRCFCDPALADVILPGTTTPRYTFQSVSIREESRTGDFAVVILNANVSGSALSWHLELDQRSSTWCISGVSTPSD